MKTRFVAGLIPRALPSVALVLFLAGCIAAPGKAPKASSREKAVVLREYQSVFSADLSVVITPTRPRAYPHQDVAVTITVSNRGSTPRMVPVALADYFRLGMRTPPGAVAGEGLEGRAIPTTILEPPEHPAPIACRELGGGESLTVTKTFPAPGRPGRYEIFTIWSAVAPVPFEVVAPEAGSIDG